MEILTTTSKLHRIIDEIERYPREHVDELSYF